MFKECEISRKLHSFWINEKVKTSWIYSTKSLLIQNSKYELKYKKVEKTLPFAAERMTSKMETKLTPIKHYINILNYLINATWWCRYLILQVR